MDADHYHTQAERCRRRAEGEANISAKKRWLELSTGWEALAKSMEAGKLKSAPHPTHQVAGRDAIGR
jgi:hypothetical protein